VRLPYLQLGFVPESVHPPRRNDYVPGVNSVNPYGTSRAALDLPARLRSLDDERDGGEGSGEEADDPLPPDLPPLSAVRLSEGAREPSEAASDECGDDFGGAVDVC
jgi:hypothetical protein